MIFSKQRYRQRVLSTGRILFFSQRRKLPGGEGDQKSRPEFGDVLCTMEIFYGQGSGIRDFHTMCVGQIVDA